MFQSDSPIEKTFGNSKKSPLHLYHHPDDRNVTNRAEQATVVKR